MFSCLHISLLLLALIFNNESWLIRLFSFLILANLSKIPDSLVMSRQFTILESEVHFDSSFIIEKRKFKPQYLSAKLKLHVSSECSA